MSAYIIHHDRATKNESGTFSYFPRPRKYLPRRHKAKENHLRTTHTRSRGMGLPVSQVVPVNAAMTLHSAARAATMLRRVWPPISVPVQFEGYGRPALGRPDIRGNPHVPLEDRGRPHVLSAIHLTGVDRVTNLVHDAEVPAEQIPSIQDAQKLPLTLGLFARRSTFPSGSVKVNTSSASRCLILTVNHPYWLRRPCFGAGVRRPTSTRFPRRLFPRRCSRVSPGRGCS